MGSRGKRRMLAGVVALAAAGVGIGIAGVSHAATSNEVFTVVVTDISSDVTCVVVGVDDHESEPRVLPVFVKPGEIAVVTPLMAGIGDTVTAGGGTGSTCQRPVTEPVSRDVPPNYGLRGLSTFEISLLGDVIVPHA